MGVLIKYTACSFCSKHLGKVDQLIAGPNDVYICNECVDTCNVIISDKSHRDHL